MIKGKPIPPLKREPLQLPFEVAQRFVRDMKAFHADVPLAPGLSAPRWVGCQTRSIVLQQDSRSFMDGFPPIIVTQGTITIALCGPITITRASSLMARSNER